MVKGIIFDFDGVIVESEPLFLDSVIWYLKRYGITADYSTTKQLCGMTKNNIVAAMKRDFQLQDSLDKIYQDMAEIEKQVKKVENYQLIKGVKSFLEKCRNKAIKMAIASSSDISFIEAVLKYNDIYDYFSFIVSGQFIERSKPDPQIYNVAWEKMGIDKKDLIIIEDAYNGILAGINSKIFTYGLKASIIDQNTSLANKEVHSYDEIEL
ncbi:MAG: HAD family hydrolase [Erysipelotrichaceae bacterium]